MKKILKIGDKVYSLSLQHFSDSYLTSFPQREQFLLSHAKNVSFDFFRHKILSSIEDIVDERIRLRDYLKDKSFDYLMVDNPFSSLIIDTKIKYPILFDCIDWYDEMFLKEFGVKKKYYLLRYGYLDLLARASKVIAQSPVLLESMKSWGLRTKDTVVIPNGYDAEYFYPYSAEKIQKLKKRFSAQFNVNLQSKKIIVYAGKLGRWYKDIKIITEAIEEDQIFFVVGDGPILHEIPNRKNIIKTGPLDYRVVPEFINIADALVFPVDVDCSPLAISEYLAVGKPIVMGRGRMEWLLKDGKSGCMVDNSVYGWKVGIDQALQMKSSCMKNNLELAKELSWKKLSEKFVSFLQ